MLLYWMLWQNFYVSHLILVIWNLYQKTSYTNQFLIIYVITFLKENKKSYSHSLLLMIANKMHYILLKS